MFLYSIIIVAIISASGCGFSKPPEKLYIKEISGFPESFQNRLKDVINEINKDAGQEIISSTDGKDRRPLFIYKASFVDSNNLQVNGEAGYSEYRCLIQLDDSKSILKNKYPEDLDLKFIFLHEIGHCMRYKHSEDAESVMYPYFEGFNKMNSEEKELAKESIQLFLNEIVKTYFK